MRTIPQIRQTVVTTDLLRALQDIRRLAHEVRVYHPDESEQARAAQVAKDADMAIGRYLGLERIYSKG